MILGDCVKSEMSIENNETLDRWSDDPPIPDPRIAAYHIGRLINQLNWHLQHFLIFDRSADREVMIDLILGKVDAATYQLMFSPANRFSPIVAKVGEQWKRWLGSQAVAEDLHSVLHATEFEHEDESLQDGFQRLVTMYVTDIIQQLQSSISGELLEDERRMLELGCCLDQGVRRLDVCRFIFDGLEFQEVPCDPTERYPYDFEIHSWPRWKTFSPGDLEPDPSWFDKLQAVVEKAGLLEVASGPIQKIWNGRETPDNMLSKIDAIDTIICEQLRTDGKIPIRWLSRPMTLDQAARFHAGERVTNPTKYFQRLYEQGRVRRPIGSKKRLQFDVRDFPEEVRSQMVPSRV